MFRRKIDGTNRAKQFITAVALSGVYESFRLDKNTFELGGRAIGGAAYIDFERYLCGDEDIAESTNLLLEGLQEAVYGEIQRALLAAVNADNRPAKNKYIGAGFDADAMASLCAVASAYSASGSVVIYATPEFVAEMARMLVYEQYKDDAYTKGLNVFTTITSEDQEAAYRRRQGLCRGREGTDYQEVALGVPSEEFRIQDYLEGRPSAP